MATEDRKPHIRIHVEARTPEGQYGGYTIVQESTFSVPIDKGAERIMDAFTQALVTGLEFLGVPPDLLPHAYVLENDSAVCGDCGLPLDNTQAHPAGHATPGGEA